MTTDLSRVKYNTLAQENGRQPFEPLTCRRDARPKTGTEFRGNMSVGSPRPFVYVSTERLEPHRRYWATFEVRMLDGVGFVIFVRDPEPL